jgi:hypothetical protein
MEKKQFNDKYISSLLKKYENKTLFDSKGERCRIISYSYYKGNKTINLILSKGFGAAEIKENLTFPEHDLEIKLESFSIAPKIDNSDIITPNNVKFNYKHDINNTNKNQLTMSKQTDDNLTGLRTHLFNAIRKLEGGTMKNEEAKAMAQVAQVIINSAKLEMEFKQLTNDKPTINMID